MPVKLMGRTLGALLAVGTFIVMAFGHWTLPWALLLFGGVGYVWAWAQLARQEQQAASVSAITANANVLAPSGTANAEDAASSPKPPSVPDGNPAPKA